MSGKAFRDRDNRALHEKKMNESVRMAVSRQNIEFILAHQHDSAEELSSYLRKCKEELGHVPAQSEVLGGELLTLRFGSWTRALESAGFQNCKGQAVSNFPLERTALFRAEYERQSALHVQQKNARKKQAEADRRELKSQKKREKNAAAAGGSK